MHRAPLLTLLQAYLRRNLAADERVRAEEVIRFVGTHPDCLLRSCAVGHITSSAWIVNQARTATLLTHHRKLDKWLQLGGHTDGETDVLAAALREAREESGLTRLQPVSPEIFDVDVHPIPARPREPEHLHYDVRFMLVADEQEPLVVSSESKDLAWVEFTHVPRLNTDESVARMVRKTSSF